MDKLGEYSLLYDFYGQLLTGKQRQIYEEVRFGDLSLSEASELFGVSRQGIHDMVRRVETALERYEEKLGLPFLPSFAHGLSSCVRPAGPLPSMALFFLHEPQQIVVNQFIRIRNGELPDLFPPSLRNRLSLRGQKPRDFFHEGLRSVRQILFFPAGHSKAFWKMQCTPLFRTAGG